MHLDHAASRPARGAGRCSGSRPPRPAPPLELGERAVAGVRHGHPQHAEAGAKNPQTRPDRARNAWIEATSNGSTWPRAPASGSRDPALGRDPGAGEHDARLRSRGSAAASGGRRSSADRRVASVDGFPLLDRGQGPLRGDGRAGSRAQRRLPRLVRGRARRVLRPRGRLPGNQGSRGRSVHDRGHYSLPPGRRSSTSASDPGALRRRPGRALPFRVPDREGRARRRGAHEPRVRGRDPQTDRVPEWLAEAVAKAEPRVER